MTSTKYNEGNTAETQKKLLQKMACHRAAGLLMDLVKINTLISDAGLKKTTTDQSVPVFRHDFNTLKAATGRAGEWLSWRSLLFFEENSADYPLGLSSESL